MRYGILTGGQLVYAPSRIKNGDTVTYNPSGEMLIQHGYLPITETPYPQTDEKDIDIPKYLEAGENETEEPIRYEKSYVEKDGHIAAVWLERRANGDT